MAALRRLGRVAALAGTMNSRGLRATRPALPLVLDDASPVSVGGVVAHPMSCLSSQLQARHPARGGGRALRTTMRLRRRGPAGARARGLL